MEVQVVVDLNGIEEALHQLGPRLAKKTMRKSLRKAAKVWQKEMKIRTPVDTGQLRDDIDIFLFVNGRNDEGSVLVGPTKHSFYGRFLEFGTKNMTAKPFVRPTFDAKANEVLETFVESLRSDLEEVLR
jgi:HK97 gp10 family phage protein